MEKKRLLVIASSAKNSGACIACVDVDTGEFIRPVPYNTGREWRIDPLKVSLLSLWEVPVIGKLQEDYQPENYSVDDISKWQPLGYYSNEQFEELYLEKVKSNCYRLLFKEGYIEVNNFPNPVSVDIVEVNDLFLMVVDEENENGEIKPRLRAKFFCRGEEYFYKVTYKFPIEEWNRLKKERGLFLKEKFFLTLTGAKFRRLGRDYFHVFISGIIPHPEI